jgi:hypothetical protein
LIVFDIAAFRRRFTLGPDDTPIAPIPAEAACSFHHRRLIDAPPLIGINICRHLQRPPVSFQPTTRWLVLEFPIFCYAIHTPNEFYLHFSLRFL